MHGSKMTVQSKQERLHKIIAEKSLKIGDFILASGAKSTYIFDIKMTMLDPEGANLAADLILDRIANDEVDAIGGLELGACPIVSAICIRTYQIGRELKTFYVRKEQKGRGTARLIEGCELKETDKVIIVEDVATTGGSALNAIKTVRGVGCEVVKVFTIIDRLEGAKAMLEKEGIQLESLFTRSDFLVPV
jgi:orotate phosphoribosyltransferase